MKAKYYVSLAVPVAIVVVFASYVYYTAYMSCPEHLQWDLSCSFPEAPNGPVLALLYEMIVYWDDFDDVPDEKLFLEKYPQAEMYYEKVGYGFHLKHYRHTDESSGSQVYLMMVKIAATGKTDNLISCPPNNFGSYGYTVWNENIGHYLQNYDCFSDDRDDYFH